MFIGKIAQGHLKENFHGYNSASEEFETLPNIQGRLGPVDRFLSIYSLPTKKRQFFVKPNTVIPDNGVIKHSSTGKMFLVGVERLDSRHDVNGGNPYVGVRTVHEVGSTDFGFTGKAIIRKLERAASGYLEYVSGGECFADLEFRGTVNDSNTDKETFAGFFCWYQTDITLEQWDTLELGGVEYRITDAYIEMGLKSCRVTNDANPFVPATLLKTATKYNPVTYTHDKTIVEENFTAILHSDVDKTHWADGFTPRVELYIPNIAIDDAPVIGDSIRYQNIVRKIKYVEHKAGDKQYIVSCE